SAGVRRRLARWDGSCAYGVGSPDDVRAIRALVERERGSADGFDIKVGGRRDPGLMRAMAGAGATWWNDWMPPGDPEATRRAIARGALRWGGEGGGTARAPSIESRAAGGRGRGGAGAGRVIQT